MHKLAFVLTVTAGVLGLPYSASGVPELLFEFSQMGNGGGAPETDFRVQVVLRHSPDHSPSDAVYFGLGVFWADGESGIVDFTSDTDPNFEEFATRLTDGVDELVAPLALDVDNVGTGSVALESEWGFGSPDLVGNSLDFIRLIVDDVRVEPWEPEPGVEGFLADVDFTFQFWGTPIPEPSTLMLLMVGCVIARPKREQARTRNEHATLH